MSVSLDPNLGRQETQLSPISRIPEEVLAEIFLWCAQSPWTATTTDLSQVHFHHGRGTWTEWTVVSHVCRHWRAVALEFPELWSRINARMPVRWMEAMIERSKDVPISIINFYLFRILCLRKREILLNVLSEPSRWRQIDVDLPHRNGVVFKLISSLTTPAPSLVDLALNVGTSDYHGSPKVLPWNFLAASAPSLRRLKVVGCEPSWNPDLYSDNLTSLKLSHTPLARARLPGPSPAEFGKILAGIPRLTELDLEMNLPDLSTLEPASRTFDFPLLQKLRLVGECGELARMLGCLRIPSTACVDITCAQADETKILALGWALEKAWTAKPIIKSLRLESFRRDFAGYKLSSPGGNPLAISVATGISGWVGYLVESESLPNPFRLLGAASLDDVKTLHFSNISSSIGEGPEQRTIFERMKAVENIIVAGQGVRDFFQAVRRCTKLSDPHAQSGGSTSVADAVPFPFLKTLTVPDANLLPNDEGLYNGTSTQATIFTIKDIVEWMQERRLLGLSMFKELLFQDCGGFTPRVEELLQKIEKSGTTENLKQEGCTATAAVSDPDPYYLNDPYYRISVEYPGGSW
jgi:F-box-like